MSIIYGEAVVYPAWARAAMAAANRKRAAGVSTPVVMNEKALPLSAQQALAAKREQLRPQAIAPGVVMVTMEGATMADPSMIDLLCDDVMPTSMAAAAVREGARAAESSMPMGSKDRRPTLVIDANLPGGTVAGMSDLLAAMAEAKTKAKVVVIAHELLASGGYWLASQADEIIATPTARVGNIGAYAVIDDESKAFEAAGITRHVIKVGDFKGLGAPGAPVTVADVGEIQRNLNQCYGQFIAGVASGRGISLEAATKLGDGRIHYGSDAVALGLADRCMDFEAAKAAIVSESSNQSGSDRGGAKTPARVTAATKEVRMSATLAELKAAFPGEPEFVIGCLESQATMDQARSKHNELVAERMKGELAKSQAELAATKASVAALQKEAADAKAGLETKTKEMASLVAGGVKPGVAPVNSGGGGGDASAGADGAKATTAAGFEAEVQTLQAEARTKGVFLTRVAAVGKAKAVNPKGHAAYLDGLRNLTVKPRINEGI